MALAETANLIASLELQDKMSAGLRKASANLSTMETRMGRIGTAAQRGFGTAAANLAKIGAVAGVAIGAAVKGGIDSLAELESAVASVDGAITQMGLAGKVSGSQIATWANEIETSIGAAFDDKEITQATSTLIRFGKVTQSNLRPAMEVMTDLAAKTGSVESAAELLAKALADPTKAAGKLARQGIVLTKAQQATIKAMVEANDVAGAQAYILAELEKTTKGAAAASQGPYRRAMSVLADVTEDAQRALAEGFLPVLMRASELLSKALADPKVIANIRSFGKTLATGLDSLISIAQNLPWQQIGASLQLAGVGAKAVLGAFTALPPWVQTAVLTGWGLNKLSGGALGGIGKELVKGLVGGALGQRGATPANPLFTKEVGLGGALDGGGGGPAKGATGFVSKLAPLALLAGQAGAAAAVALATGQALVGDPRSNGQMGGTRGDQLARRAAEQTKAINGVGDKVSTASAEIRNGFVTARAGDATTASRLQSLSATMSAGLARTAANALATANAIRAKNMSPRVNVNVGVTIPVSVRAVTNGQATVARYTGGRSTGYVIR